MNLKKRLIEIKTNFHLYIPFIIASLLTLTSMILVWIKPEFTDENGQITGYQVNDTVKYFFYGIIFNLVLILIHKNLWKYTFLLQLILAFWGLIHVLNVTIEIYLGIVKIEIVSVLLLLIHVAINKDIIKFFLGTLNIDEEKAEQERQSIIDSAIDRFTEIFSDKTYDELSEISKSESYTNEAKEAAKRLMAEK